MKRSDLIFFLIFFSYLVFTGLVAYIVYAISVPVTLDESILFKIKKGQSISSIARSLKEEKVIRSEQVFKAFIKFKKADTLIQSGYFYLPQKISIGQLVDIFTAPGAYSVEKVTIPEGFSLSQIAERLEQQGVVTASVFVEYINTRAKEDFRAEFEFLNFESDYKTIEGYLFPETYFFNREESVKKITEAFLNQFSTSIYKYYLEQELSSKWTFHELVTMASLIEKETNDISEMPLIASVFYNRLADNMRLMTDPTVVYALGLSYKSKIYYKDLAVDSPYNTYKYAGLPPTPIASPGLLAFKAALYPDKSNYFFFVAQSGGGHYFSKTYQEHLKAQGFSK